jgi:hypothetical protein
MAQSRLERKREDPATSVRLWAMITVLLMLLAVGASQPFTMPAHGAALFDQGRTWDSFLAAADARQDTWTTNTSRSRPPRELVERLRGAGDGLRFLVVAVASCSDSVHTVPYLATLALEADIPLRILDSTAGKPVMDAFRTPDGRGATPTVAILRGDRIVAAWVEQPADLQAWWLGPARALPAPERLQRKFGWYEWDRGEMTMREIVALVERHR